MHVGFFYSFIFLAFYSCPLLGVLLSQSSVAQRKDKPRVQKIGVYVEEKQDAATHTLIPETMQASAPTLTAPP